MNTTALSTTQSVSVYNPDADAFKLLIADITIHAGLSVPSIGDE